MRNPIDFNKILIKSTAEAEYRQAYEAHLNRLGKPEETLEDRIRATVNAIIPKEDPEQVEIQKCIHIANASTQSTQFFSSARNLTDHAVFEKGMRAYEADYLAYRARLQDGTATLRDRKRFYLTYLYDNKINFEDIRRQQYVALTLATCSGKK